MTRVSIKAVGASGQGINSIGEVVAKGLKRSGYCVFGYREYPSLIMGGHASYQLDADTVPVRSSETLVDVLVTLNYRGLQYNIRDVKKGGIVIHDVDSWKFPPEDQTFIEMQGIRVIYIPLDQMLRQLKAKPLLANVLLTAFVWEILGQDRDALKALVREQYEHKGQEIVAKNLECIDAGAAFTDPVVGCVTVAMPKASDERKNHLLLTGSQAMGLGAIHAGMRLYAGYPMTPSSPFLSYIASKQKDAGFLVKQAEDEITAVEMASGAMLMGTRAMTATSGGGYDLMTETMSLNGMIENPMVVLLAQRPGPATGNPTWTAQGDLLMAVHSSHGEFPRCVLSVSDAEDCFRLMSEAFNVAEEYQLPVILLTDKHTAESLFVHSPFDQKTTEVRRGRLVTDPKELATLKSTDRYDHSTKDGITPRWLPGTEAATFCSQGDEHTADGSSDDSAKNAKEQMEKRMRKMVALKEKLPGPELYCVEKDKGLRTKDKGDVDVLVVGWGSTKGAVLDVIEQLKIENGKWKIGYLHYTYLWPLKTERFMQLSKTAKKIILVEGNSQGQLGMLIRQECGYEITEKILKYDGRPFFVDELQQRILPLLQPR